MPQPPAGFDIGALLSQAQKLQEEMAAAQERARAKSVEASSGGGMVTATMNGALELVALKIDPQVIDPKDAAMLQDLVAAAVNQAIARAQEMMQKEMQGLNLPQIPGLQGLF